MLHLELFIYIFKVKVRYTCETIITRLGIFRCKEVSSQNIGEP